MTALVPHPPHLQNHIQRNCPRRNRKIPSGKGPLLGFAAATRPTLLIKTRQVFTINRNTHNSAGRIHSRLGRASLAYGSANAYVLKQPSQWLCHERKAKAGKFRRLPDETLWADCGLTRRGVRKPSFP